MEGEETAGEGIRDSHLKIMLGCGISVREAGVTSKIYLKNTLARALK